MDIDEFSNGTGGTPRVLEPESHSSHSQSPFSDRDEGTGKLVSCHGNMAVQSQAASKVPIFVLFQWTLVFHCKVSQLSMESVTGSLAYQSLPVDYLQSELPWEHIRACLRIFSFRAAMGLAP